MSIYTIYQITNNVNNKIYIGVHKTDNPYDCYMGSGRAIRNAIAKYGVSNFTKTILFTYDNAQDAFAKEAEIVTEEFISSDTNYNCKVGGRGGWDHVRDDDTRKLAYERKKEALIDKYGVENGWRLLTQPRPFSPPDSEHPASSLHPDRTTRWSCECLPNDQAHDRQHR